MQSEISSPRRKCLQFVLLGILSLVCFRPSFSHTLELKKLILEAPVPYAGLFQCKECGHQEVKSVSHKDLGIPIVDIRGSLAGISKEIKIPAYISYFSKHTTIEGEAWVDLQGNFSLRYPKKNINISFRNRKKKVKVEVNPAWGIHSKYCLKANWTDTFHSRNVVSARLFAQMLSSSNLKDNLAVKSPNYGVTDGMPVALYRDGNFHGLYAIQIPKAPWMFGIEKKAKRQAILMGVSDSKPACYLEADVTASFSEGMKCIYKSEEMSHSEVARSFNAFRRFVSQPCSEAEFKKFLPTYTSVSRAIDHLLLVAISGGSDNVASNTIYVTYDGTRWIPLVYDMDLTWNNLNGKGQAPDWAVPSLTMGSALWKKLVLFYKPEIVARWMQLRRNGIISYENITQLFQDYTDKIPEVVKVADKEKWKEAYKEANHWNRITSYVKARLDFLDGLFFQWQAEINKDVQHD